MNSLDKQAENLKDLLQAITPDNKELILDIHRVLHEILVNPEAMETRMELQRILIKTNGMMSCK